MNRSNEANGNDYSIYPTKMDAYEAGIRAGRKIACKNITRVLKEFGNQLVYASAIIAIIETERDWR